MRFRKAIAEVLTLITQWMRLKCLGSLSGSLALVLAQAVLVSPPRVFLLQGLG